MDRLSLESKLQKSVVARNFYWVEVHDQTYGYLDCLMLDLEWRLDGLCNLEDPLAAPDCHWFSLLFKSFKNVRKHTRNI